MPFSTVTVPSADAVRPAASRATAVTECAPSATFVVSHEATYGALMSSAPSWTPSTKNFTPATPTLSEALAETLITPETVAPSAGAVMDTDAMSCRGLYWRLSP